MDAVSLGLTPGKVLGAEDLSEMFGLDMAQSASPEPSKPKRAKKAAPAPEAKAKPRKKTTSKKPVKRTASLKKPRRRLRDA